MPDINPYEAPQSEQLPSAEEQFLDEPFPPWLGRALWTQLAAIVILGFIATITNVPDSIELCSILFIGLLSLFNLITAIRYRIGWLVLLELIVIGLPMMVFFTIDHG